MSKLIFRLRNVPDDEAEEVRQLLKTHAIEFYETDAGNWGVSMPGLWLTDESDAARAKNLIERYQQDRAANARSEYEEKTRSGSQRTVIDSMREKPLACAGLILFCLFVLYFSIKPFFTFAR